MVRLIYNNVPNLPRFGRGIFFFRIFNTNPEKTRFPRRKVGTMVKASFNLPAKYRFELRIVKRRKNLDDNPLLPDLGKIARVRKGSKISRFFTHIFEHASIKKIFGINLVFLSLASSAIPINSLSYNTNDGVILASPTIFQTEEGTQMPVETIKITQNFRFYHPGIDLDGETGDPIYPIMSGTVESVDYSILGYGKSVVISHGNGIDSLYAHLSKIYVSKGQWVEKQTKIGEMGSTGHAIGDHLHLEIHESGKAINPLSVLPY